MTMRRFWYWNTNSPDMPMGRLTETDDNGTSAALLFVRGQVVSAPWIFDPHISWSIEYGVSHPPLHHMTFTTRVGFDQAEVESKALSMVRDVVLSVNVWLQRLDPDSVALVVDTRRAPV